MSKKTIFKLFIVFLLGTFDTFISRMYDATQSLVNSRSAVQALKNSNEAYVASQVFQFDGTFFYGTLCLINFIIIYLMFKPNKKDKIEDKEE